MFQSFSPPCSTVERVIIPSDAHDRPGHVVPLYFPVTPLPFVAVLLDGPA
jgi:hypothetical protein